MGRGVFERKPHVNFGVRTVVGASKLWQTCPMHAVTNAPRRSQSTQPPQAYGWYVLALGVSLGLHAAFLVWSKAVTVNGLRESTAPMLLPPKFVVRQVTVDPKTLLNADDVAKVPEKVAPPVEALVFADSKPQAVEMKMEAKPVELSKTLVDEKPQAAPVASALPEISSTKLGSLDSQLSSLSGGFLQTAPVSRVQPVLAMGKGDPNGSKTGPDVGIPGRQSIDKVLEGIGQVPTRESPVAIPGNALFGYDSVELGPDSLPILEKIADLRRRFPDYIMVIIGHTDGLGTPEYNQRLSQRRAEAVKEWLIKRYAMNPAKLETSGKGSSELLVPVTRSVEEQAPNRRVEVLLRPVTPEHKPARRAN